MAAAGGTKTTPVEQRDLVQWFFRITAYAQELLDGLDKLDGWPEKVRTMQRNWIGRSEGTDVDFFLAEEIDEGAGNRDQGSEKTRIRVFTTRVDTIFGATSVQLAPQHALVAEFTAADAEAEGAGRRAARAAEEGARGGRPGRDRKARRSDRPLCHQPLQRRARAHLGGQLHSGRLRHRRHHERSRRTTSATSSLPPSTACRSCR